MKSTLFLVLGLCTVMSAANAQYGRENRRDDKYVDSDALENQAIQKLENALRTLKVEIQSNNNYGYAAPGGRGSNARGVDLLSIAITMENSSARLRDLVRGERDRRNEPSIRNESNTLNQTAFSLINAIPALSRSSANLIDNIFNVAKAVGAVELALNAPRNGGPINHGGNNNNGGYNGGRPRPQLGKGGYCSLSFKNPFGSSFLASGEGNDISGAMANLYANCSQIGGSSTGWTNAQVCQSKVAEAQCLDGYEVAVQQDPGYNRFASCSLNFRNPFGSAFVTSGAGPNLVVALAALWDSCRNIGGSSTGWTNADVCRQAVATKQFSCTVR